MSLLGMPFVDTSADTVLHIAALVFMVAVVAAVTVGFWKLHELPINKAHKEEHHQIGLITALTWIGFVWNWVWVLAVIIAFVDGEKALIKLRNIWHEKPESIEQQAMNEQPSAKEVSNNA